MSGFLARISERRGEPEDTDGKIRALHRLWLADEDPVVKTKLDALLARLPWDEQHTYHIQLACDMLGCEVGPRGWTVRWDSRGVWTVGICAHCDREVYRMKATTQDIETAPLTEEAVWYPEAVECGEVETIFAPAEKKGKGHR